MARINKRSVASLAVSVSAAALVALGTAIPSFALTNPLGPTVVVSTGGISGGVVVFRDFGVYDPTAPSVPLPIVLNGSKQTPTATFGFSDIVDARGTGAGWALTLTMSQFTSGAVLLPVGSLTLRQVPLISLRDATSSPLSTINSTGLTSTMSLDTGGAIPLFTAPAAGGVSGMGSYSVSPAELALSLPAGTKALTYLSTATVTLS